MCNAKKSPQLKQVNQNLLKAIQPEGVEVEIRLVEEVLEGIEESQLDEMWSYVGKKTNQRWLWHAIDRITGQVLAYTFGQRKDEVFLQLKKLLSRSSEINSEPCVGVSFRQQGLSMLTVRCLFMTSVLRAIWYSEILHGWLGSLLAPSISRKPLCREKKNAQN